MSSCRRDRRRDLRRRHLLAREHGVTVLSVDALRDDLAAKNAAIEPHRPYHAFPLRRAECLQHGLRPILDHFPDAVPIIDWYHAAEHLSAAARAAFPTDPAHSTPWFEAQKKWLWEGQRHRVIEAIRAESKRAGHPPRKAPDTDPRVILSRTVGYFTANQHAMDYPTYRANGWPIGSGVAEATVKQFGLRVKGSDQFWNVWGAEEMLALCALQACEDGRWARYWKERSPPPADADRFDNSTP